VDRNAYSVPSRLIGEQVEARLNMDHVEVWHEQKKVAAMPRLRPIRFRVFTVDQSATYEVQFSKSGASYTPVSDCIISNGVGRRKKLLPEWFRQEPPIIRFEQDSFTRDNLLCRHSSRDADLPGQMHTHYSSISPSRQFILDM
jgi:hypothetical protein